MTLSTFYDFQTDDILFGSTTPIIQFKDMIAIDIGVITESENTYPIAGLSLNLNTFFEKIGASFLIPEPISIGGFISRNFADNEYFYGPYVGAIWEW